MGDMNIKVVVRVRPFNERELQQKQSGSQQCVVQMIGNTTTLMPDPRDNSSKERQFIYDKSYWSHDEYEVDRATGYQKPSSPTSNYSDQLKIFDDVGKDMLSAAWKGYHSTLFAYGQTGSGKSYTVMGHNANSGLVPRICTTLFEQIDENSRVKTDTRCEVTFSMLEIYNEKVRDLLEKGKGASELKIREHNRGGFYVDGLTKRPVDSYKAISTSLNEGERNRTIAATKMNETSSRAHTIVTLNFHQIKPDNITLISHINLVDLAGSERQSQTGAEGTRFKEAVNINQSLSSLGNVLKALVDIQSGKASTHVPYRDSKLTKILSNALGGNSKTTMVGTISPALENYEQTLSTLRYAERAKTIKNKAHVNTAATDKLIQELVAEKQQLLEELEREKAKHRRGGGDEYNAALAAQIKAEYEAQISKHKLELENIQKSWEQRLQEENEANKKRLDVFNKEETLKKTTPYIWNLNEDLTLCGKIVHFLDGGNVKQIGNQKSDPAADIVLVGLGIHAKHAMIKFTGGKMSITPQKGKVHINGKEITEKKALHHNDRICFGQRLIFVVTDHRKVEKLKQEKKKAQQPITYEFAQQELAKDFTDNIDGDDMLKQSVISVMKEVNEANMIAEELNKDCHFDITLVSALARGQDEGRTEVYIKLTDNFTGNKYMWDSAKFSNRHGVMMELYNQFESGENVLESLDQDDDPFYEPYETPCVVGVVGVPLLSLSFMEEYDETLTIMSYEAETVGRLDVSITPCDAKGNEDTDIYDDIEDSVDLSNRNLHFKIKIRQAHGLPTNFKETWCRFRFFTFSDDYMSVHVTGINPQYGYEKLISVRNADHTFIHYVDNKDLCIEILGYQDIKVLPAAKALAGARHNKEILKTLKTENEFLRAFYENVSRLVIERPMCNGCDATFTKIRSEIINTEEQLDRDASNENT